MGVHKMYRGDFSDNGFVFFYFLEAFTKLWKATVSFVIYFIKTWQEKLYMNTKLYIFDHISLIST